jgi:hypothetical protein
MNEPPGGISFAIPIDNARPGGQAGPQLPVSAGIVTANCSLYSLYWSLCVAVHHSFPPVCTPKSLLVGPRSFADPGCFIQVLRVVQFHKDNISKILKIK